MFIKVGIFAASAKIYAQTFSTKEIMRNCLHMLDHTLLKELGIRTMGDMLAILKLIKKLSVSLATHVNPPTAKVPQLNLEMTPEQFQKFSIDWDLFTKMINLPTAQSNIQLYNCAHEFIQNSIIKTYPKFFNMNPSKLLDMLEVLVMQKSNRMVHQISFSSIIQSHNESGAQDCNFICLKCDHDLSSVYIKVQFIRGIANDMLWVDMLAKAGLLKILEQNIQKVKEWLLDQFALMAFNNNGKFPVKSGPQAYIHLKKSSAPKAKHNPIPVPYLYKEEIKKILSLPYQLVHHHGYHCEEKWETKEDKTTSV